MALPEPQGGLVISYSYLWRRESEAGLVEGAKNRPCAIVLAVRRERPEAAMIVTVAPSPTRRHAIQLWQWRSRRK
jgi:hypothetical protein